ncbi:MAG TPA: type II toxin-antitoxin system PemK/MazF family toxin [Verrucomicrobiae bacterium]|nr:type II toxin-antitoxin system PemK/MazF family toxin [Verrucomicrobiae bacterium]
MTKGKVVLVPFPFDDLTATKVRPAVCLTEPIGIHRHVILGFVSSQPPQNLEATDILLHPRHIDFGRTGLRVASVLRIHRVVTLSTNLIQRELGELSAALQQEMNRKLMVLFGLNMPSRA